MITIGRLGIPGKFISEVGNDRIGNYILEFLEKNGVGTEFMERYDAGKSALSLAFLNELSDAEYDFYKDYPNQRLGGNLPVFQTGDYLLFGSFYGLNPVLRPQVETILDAANKQGILIYYDPNFRSSHLADLSELKAYIEKNMHSSTVVRASDEDMRNIYGVQHAEEAWNMVSTFCNVFIYTANASGVDLFTKDFHFHMDVDRIEPVSTIGAGDTFNAGIMYGLYSRGIVADSILSLGEEDWKEILSDAALFSKEVCLSMENYISADFATEFNRQRAI